MVAGVADTHAAVWHLYGDPRLSDAARRFVDSAAAQGRKVALSAISLVGIVYLIEKGRVQPETLVDLTKVLNDPEGVFQEVPVDQGIIAGMLKVPRDQIPDLPDRIIAATANVLGVPVVSRDGRIRSSSIETV